MAITNPGPDTITGPIRVIGPARTATELCTVMNAKGIAKDQIIQIVIEPHESKWHCFYLLDGTEDLEQPGG